MPYQDPAAAGTGSPNRRSRGRPGLKALFARGNGSVVSPSPHRPSGLAGSDLLPRPRSTAAASSTSRAAPTPRSCSTGSPAPPSSSTPWPGASRCRGGACWRRSWPGTAGLPRPFAECRGRSGCRWRGGDLDRLEGARRRFVVGCSMGALVACALARERPRAVDGLVLLSPALRLAFPAKRGRPARPPGAPGRPRGPEGRLRRARPGDAPPQRGPLRASAGRPGGALGGSRATSSSSSPGSGRRRWWWRRGATTPSPSVESAGWSLGWARPAELRVLPESFHLVAIDVERDRCAEEAVRFLARLATPGGG